MKGKRKVRFHKKKGFATVPTDSRIMKKLQNVTELRILNLEGRWIMTFQKVAPPPEDKVEEAETYEQNKD